MSKKVAIHQAKILLTNWKRILLYCSMKRAVDEAKVFKDVAERGVALMTSFNEAITRQEAQK